MNTDTGEIYNLRKAEEAERALKAMRSGEMVVPVSERVAQKVRLGERELERRQRRRRSGGVIGT